MTVVSVKSTNVNLVSNFRKGRRLAALFFEHRYQESFFNVKYIVLVLLKKTIVRVGV